MAFAGQQGDHIWYVQLAAIWHWYLLLCIYITVCNLSGFCPFLFSIFFFNLLPVNLMVDLPLCALLTGLILKGLTLRKFVSDVCVCFMFAK